ncbi:MAG TPA: HNH endonuclease [Candidatus Aminicenantes bacterium]|nr:HNH endonuclease [Candidatus Aminicenantes bacterium]
MRFYAGVTDQDWFDYLRSLPDVDEVNFWQPSPGDEFRALSKGDLFLFKLHRSARTRKRDLIAGGGVFVSYSVLPISLAWEAFEHRNGAATYSEMRRRLLSYRRIPDNPHKDFRVGCIVLTQPFFFDESLWFQAPEWKGPIVRGKAKGYEMDKEAGKLIWESLQRGWKFQRIHDLDGEARRIEDERARYGKETTIRPRLGQGAFRVLVTDAYQRACAITEEHSLPVLEAAHIKPYIESGPHAVNNGLLLRSDLHRLFDRGYITITPDYRIEVSRRLKEEFENGRSYYPFSGQHLSHLPEQVADRPQRDLLVWHNDSIFKG